MRIRGLARLKAAWAELLCPLTPGPMILLYQRIAQLAQDPELPTVTPAHFEEQLLALRRHYQTVFLEELRERLRSKSGGR
jgi:hypothetical protein